MKYPHLTIRISRIEILKIKFYRLLGILFVKLPILGKLIRRLGGYLTYLGRLQEKETDQREWLKAAHHPGSNYAFGYAQEIQELIMVDRYFHELKDVNFDHSRLVLGPFYEHVIQKISALLKMEPSITEVINFGVNFAYIDSVLAKRFPAVRFVGIDRSAITKAYNDHYLKLTGRDAPNLEIVSHNDILKFLEDRKLAGQLFLHIRTLIWMPEFFVDNLYRRLAQKECGFIFGVENIGISRQTGRPFEFTDSFQSSVYFRDRMALHNYPGLLTRHGFAVRESEIFKTNNPYADTHFVSVLAQRKNTPT